jgi:hypothetical protein
LAFVGHVDPVLWWLMFALAVSVELPLHLLLAHYWNRRVVELAISG